MGSLKIIIRVKVSNIFLFCYEMIKLTLMSQVRILNHITWKKITQFEHPATINNTKAVSIF